MEKPGKTCQRLVAALERLVAEEQCVARTGEIEKISTVQQRANSIITRLAELMDDSGAAAPDFDLLRPRFALLQARRTATMEIMGARLTEMRATLNALDAARGRLGNMRNAYGLRRRTNQPVASRLSISA